ncbi:ANK [Mytilus coruscus]|uniref:ANK n=1 Tax=Mytilus coruscus TaxID=42192 RepID=A0A6J8AJU0_MYTCO|nr:ANK [Mytilus coruscus]
MFDIILRLSHPDIIRDRYQFEINQRYQSKDSLVIFVPMEKESDYMERLCKDINDGYVQKVFTNKQLQYLTFRLKFIDQLRLKSNLKRNVRAFQDVSPLLVVSQQNYLDIMEALLKIKVDVNVNKFGTTPLFIASENDQVGMVKLLLTYKCDPNQRRGLKNGETPLHVASEKGHKQVVKLLIKHNANTNICSTNQETPLYIALSKGFIDIVEILLEKSK